MKPDKGNGVVIVNRTEYVSKVEQILSDIIKFERLTSDPLKNALKREKELRSFVENRMIVNCQI